MTSPPTLEALQKGTDSPDDPPPPQASHRGNFCIFNSPAWIKNTGKRGPYLFKKIQIKE